MNMPRRSHRFTRRTFLLGTLGGSVLGLAGCGWDGHFTILGYNTKPNYDSGIKTVYVPIFKNQTFQTTPYRGMEFELTRAVQTAIEQRAGYKVTSDPEKADTELLGTLKMLSKNLQNRTQQNDVREGELVLGVEVVWRDLRSGKILSNPPQPEGLSNPEIVQPFDPEIVPVPEGPEEPIPVQVRAIGRYLPEVGESNATAQTRLCNQLALQIVQLMEKPWQLPPRQGPSLPR